MIESSPVDLHVVESGEPDGVPLVALHGVGNSHRTFGFVPPLLPPGIRLLRADLRGHGESPKPGRYALDDYVGDVVALLRTLPGPAALVGHSLGGIVAWTVARRRPELVRAALLEDPPLAPGPRPAASLRYFRDLAELARRWQTEGATPETVAARLAELPAGPRPQTAGELPAAAAPGDFRLRRLTFDVRHLDEVLDARGGRALLEQLVAAPSDRVTNAVFRAAVGTDPDGDLDCDVRVVGDGDSVAGRCRTDLGRARLTVTPLLTGSERLARRLAEARARPRDRAVRRCLEHALACDLTAVPLSGLVGVHPDAPSCAVPLTR